MKIKFFSLVVLSMIFFSCSNEEIIESQQENLLFTVEDPGQTEGNGFGGVTGPPCIQNPCDPNYVFKTVLPGGTSYRTILIEYDLSLTAEEIHCIRQEYFECFSLLRYSLLQTTNIYEDNWRIPSGKPGDNVSQTSCNDPRTNGACGD